ncbi:MAG TPA: hypothetical protein VM734_19680 [Kofleriaceae bacterium]|nr:hypothetical protein [Kofleriaceae bacterium]
MPTPSTKPVLVLDFDGTMTDAEAEGAPYVDGYLQDLAALVDPQGKKATEVTLAVRRYAYEKLADIFANPTRDAMEIGGYPVAPAIVDPYLRMTPVARHVLDKLQVPIDPGVRDRILSGLLYKYNYERTVARPVFRDGAAELLRGLGRRDDLDVWVVTNSGTGHVREKILRLDREGGGGIAWLAGRVRGNARKFVLDPGWDDGPADLHLPGLDRPVHRKRRIYAGILAALCGGDLGRLTVVGDIFELDLATPHALGARVVLIQGPYTPGYEVDHLARAERAHVVHDLGEVAALA